MQSRRLRFDSIPGDAERLLRAVLEECQNDPGMCVPDVLNSESSVGTTAGRFSPSGARRCQSAQGSVFGSLGGNS